MLQHNLAPLQTRRDIALLGLIHRTVLGLGAEHFAKWFYRSKEPVHTYPTKFQEAKHDKQIFDYLDGSHTELLRRSAFGLTRVYNELPQTTVDATSVSAFQKKLQKTVKELAQRGNDNWEQSLNCRKTRQQVNKTPVKMFDDELKPPEAEYLRPPEPMILENKDEVGDPGMHDRS